jgi:hypothetical protein
MRRRERIEKIEMAVLRLARLRCRCVYCDSGDLLTSVVYKDGVKTHRCQRCGMLT